MNQVILTKQLPSRFNKCLMQEIKVKCIFTHKTIVSIKLQYYLHMFFTKTFKYMRNAMYFYPALKTSHATESDF